MFRILLSILYYVSAVDPPRELCRSTQALLQSCDGNVARALHEVALDVITQDDWKIQVFDEDVSEHGDIHLRVIQDLFTVADDSSLRALENVVDEMGSNILAVLASQMWMADCREYLTLIERLLDCGFDVNRTFDAKRTVLHFISLYGKREDVSNLLSRGAHVHACDESGRSSLFWAAGKSYENACLLLDEGCDLAATFFLFRVCRHRHISFHWSWHTGLTNVCELVLRTLNQDRCSLHHAIVVLRKWGLSKELTSMVAGKLYQSSISFWIDIVKSTRAPIEAWVPERLSEVRMMKLSLLMAFERCLNHLYILSGKLRMQQLHLTWKRLSNLEKPFLDRVASVL